MIPCRGITRQFFRSRPAFGYFATGQGGRRLYDPRKTIFGAEKKIWLLVVLGFSAAAFLVRWIGLTIPVIGTPINIDPRELFVTLGAALTGPVGGVVIGFFAGLATIPPELDPSDLAAHIIGGLLIGFVYKPLYRCWSLLWLLFGWGGLIVAYYYLVLLPANILTVQLTDPGRILEVFGEELSFSQLYILLAPLALPEVVVTLIFTSLILVVLPDKYRRPLW
jgi:hypothetical protein